MDHLLHDTNFWVLLSFLVFVGIFIKYGLFKVKDAIDGKIDAIRTELKTAEKLRVDAQELLAEYQRKHKDAMAEANTIIAQAKQRAEDMRLKAEQDLVETMERREAQLKDRLDRIEKNARSEIEAYTASIAINTARSLMTDAMDPKSDKDIINKNLETLSKTLN